MSSVRLDVEDNSGSDGEFEELGLFSAIDKPLLSV